MSDRVATMDVCPADGEPLVGTFRRPGYEFHCVTCGAWYEWLRPRSVAWTAELQARHDELLTEFRHKFS